MTAIDIEMYRINMLVRETGAEYVLTNMVSGEEHTFNTYEELLNFLKDEWNVHVSPSDV